ncbi:alpha beta-hydrolase [Crassisporium funariophilum]|nr:alpha beta-hydrolase [Crassisporium funariophilum]
MLKLVVVLSAIALQAAAHSVPHGAPTVKLDSATVFGYRNLTSESFLGIPYAQPPIGDRRFRAAQALPKYRKTINATAYGNLCFQQKITMPQGISNFMDIIHMTELEDMKGFESEDCLSLNIIKPHSAGPSDRLPVVVWIHGGAFQIGDTSGYDAMGQRIVQRSVEMKKPVIYLSMNFRMSAYGFLAGKEVQDAGLGNLGLLDQRFALKWIQKYIHEFGGDKTKVTIWGQSSGSISVSLQMLAYGGNNEGLFRAGFMMSGSPISVGNITSGQDHYNALVTDTGCAGKADTLACLRALPLPILKASVDKSPNLFSYQSLVLVWHPRVDGVILTDDPEKLVTAGKAANIPFVSGSCDDEGTLFAASSLNVTTDAEFQTYVRTLWYPKATEAQLAPLWTLYPNDVTVGSPYNTSTRNAVTPQFKRMSSFQGDSVLQGPKRYFLRQFSGKQNVWSYYSKHVKDTPNFGSFHGSDLAMKITDDYLIQFATHLDPNIGTGVHWPRYTPQAPQLYTFPETGPPIITNDTFRAAPLEYLINLSIGH